MRKTTAPSDPDLVPPDRARPGRQIRWNSHRRRSLRPNGHEEAAAAGVHRRVRVPGRERRAGRAAGRRGSCRRSRGRNRRRRRPRRPNARSGASPSPSELSTASSPTRERPGREVAGESLDPRCPSIRDRRRRPRPPSPPGRRRAPRGPARSVGAASRRGRRPARRRGASRLRRPRSSLGGDARHRRPLDGVAGHEEGGTGLERLGELLARPRRRTALAGRSAGPARRAPACRRSGARR